MRRLIGLALALAGTAAAWLGGNYVWLAWYALARGAGEVDLRLIVLRTFETGARGIFVVGAVLVFLGVNLACVGLVLLLGRRRRRRTG